MHFSHLRISTLDAGSSEWPSAARREACWLEDAVFSPMPNCGDLTFMVLRSLFGCASLQTVAVCIISVLA